MERLTDAIVARPRLRGGVMTYSYTQVSNYLGCPRRYRHKYLDGWQEKDTRAAMLFGRAFEKALAGYFRREEAAPVSFREWTECRNVELRFSAIGLGSLMLD